jgi:hypothetical protein
LNHNNYIEITTAHWARQELENEMERIGYDLKYGYIFKHQNEAGTLVYLKGIGWVGKAAQPTAPSVAAEFFAEARRLNLKFSAEDCAAWAAAPGIATGLPAICSDSNLRSAQQHAELDDDDAALGFDVVGGAT